MNTGSTKIIEFGETFARYGIPDTLRSDNGAQFHSTEFQKFLEEYGNNHETTTSYLLQANGEVEKQNKTLLKAIRTAHVEGKDWRIGLEDCSCQNSYQPTEAHRIQ